MNASYSTTVRSLICLTAALSIGCAHPRKVFHAEETYDPEKVQRVQNSDTDLLGEAALKQPGGASYEYFRDLMPPLRYVDANFLHYPITLSAPGSTTKAKFVSNGSEVNPLTRSRSWINETG